MGIKALRIRRFLAVIFVFLAATLPTAAQESRCAVDPHDSSCALDSTLHLLRLTAVVLAIFLILIIGLVIAIYRRKKRTKLTPND